MVDARLRVRQSTAGPGATRGHPTTAAPRQGPSGPADPMAFQSFSGVYGGSR